MHRPTPLFIVLLSTLLSLGAGAQSLTPGTLANGPTDLGSCTATGANTYLCDGSTLCTWQMASFAFSCVMNPSPSSTSSATAGAASSSSSTAASGPPGQTGCVAHSGHFDCDGGVFVSVPRVEHFSDSPEPRTDLARSGFLRSASSSLEPGTAKEGKSCQLRGKPLRGRPASSMEAILTATGELARFSARFSRARVLR